MKLNRGIWFLALAIIFSCCNDSWATKDFVHASGSWPALLISDIPILPEQKIYGAIGIQPLITNNFSDPTPLILGGELHWKAHPKVSLVAGYDNWLLYPDNPQKRVNQMHPYQQVLVTHKFKDWSFQGRFRIEEISSDGFNNLSVRSRNRFRFTHPLPSLIFFDGRKSKWYLAVSDEVHFNLNDKPSLERGFEENFMFVGLGRKINEHVSLEGGYYMLFTKVTTGKPYKLNHLLGLTASIKL